MPYTRILSYGSRVEITEYEKEPIRDRSYSKRKARVSKRNSQSVSRRADNVYRTKRAFTRLVGANLTRDSVPLLLTLTMYEVVSIKRAYSAFTLFFKRVRVRAGKDFRYVGVPEFQSDYDFGGKLKVNRGAVHFHVLVWDLPFEFYNERNTRVLQHLWQRGFVDCIATDGSDALAPYLAKYMSKAMHDIRLRGEKGYSASRNLVRPVLRSFNEEASDVAEYFVAVDNPPFRSKEFMTQWLGKGRYNLYLN